MIRKTLLILFALLFVQLTAISKQIPGSNYGVLNSQSNGKYFVQDHYSSTGIYDLDNDTLVKSFRISPLTYAVTNNNLNYIDNKKLKKVDLHTGEEILTLDVSTVTNNEAFRSIVLYKDNYFIYETSSSYYLVEDTESAFEFTFLFKKENDFMLGNNKGIYYNGGQIIYIGDDGFPRSFSHEFENGVRAFTYKDGYIIYSLQENGTDYIASYNTLNEVKRRVENREAYKLKIVGDKVVTYKNILWKSLSVMSFDLFEYYVFDMSVTPIKYLTVVDDNRIVATSEMNSTSFLLDLDKETKKQINRFCVSIEALEFSKDSNHT
ncbi:MAG: hypothetical protein ACE364_01025 [Chlorobiota bacterium]